MNLTEDKIRIIADKCINCGFCETVCPTYEASNFRAIIGARGRVNLSKEIVNSELQISSKIVESFYSCLSCNACLSVCPAGISAGEISILARQDIVEHGNKKSPVTEMIAKLIMKYNSPLALNNINDKWTDGLKFYKDSPILLYTGQMYILSAYSKDFSKMTLKLGKRLSNVGSILVTRIPVLMKMLTLINKPDTLEKYERYLKNIYMLLSKADIKVNFLQNEPYPGTFLYELGYMNEFKTYANKLTRLFKENGVKKIVTVDPHTYDILKNKYPRVVQDFDFEVVYYLDLLNNLNFRKTENEIIFHESCHFVRGESKYDIANLFLQNLVKLNLPEHNGSNTYCCGGPAELMFPEISSKISQKRYDELRNTGNGKIVTACPICLTNLDKDGDLEDISEILAENVGLR